MAKKQTQPKQFNTEETEERPTPRVAVSNVILEFDDEIAGFGRLMGLVAERAFHIRPTTSGQRIEFPPGVAMVVVTRSEFTQAGCGISWSRLADFIVAQGFVVDYSDSEIVISTTPPESEVVYKPAPDTRPGAQGAAPPPWSSAASLRNTRPTP